MINVYNVIIANPPLCESCGGERDGLEFDSPPCMGPTTSCTSNTLTEGHGGGCKVEVNYSTNLGMDRTTHGLGASAIKPQTFFFRRSPQSFHHI